MHFSNIDSRSILKVDFSSYTWRSKVAHLDDLKYIKCTNFVLKCTCFSPGISPFTLSGDSKIVSCNHS